MIEPFITVFASERNRGRSGHGPAPCAIPGGWGKSLAADLSSMAMDGQVSFRQKSADLTSLTEGEECDNSEIGLRVMHGPLSDRVARLAAARRAPSFLDPLACHFPLCTDGNPKPITLAT